MPSAINFGEAKVTKKRVQNKIKLVYFFYADCIETSVKPFTRLQEAGGQQVRVKGLDLCMESAHFWNIPMSTLWNGVTTETLYIL